MPRLYRKRFTDIDELAEQVEASTESRFDAYSSRNELHVNDLKLTAWVVRTDALIQDACGVTSMHVKHFTEASKGGFFTTNHSRFQKQRAVFLAAKADYDCGYLSSVDTLVQAEVYSDELEQATELLGKKYKVAAAVIAGVVLETSLRKLCEARNIPAGKLDKMNADLTKLGLYNLLQQKQITAWANVRNDAAHGNPDGFKDADVGEMIVGVQRFLAEHLY